MSVIKDSTEINTSYENFSAVCPFCGHENTFNRRSDLRDTEPIDRREVNCGRCGRPFGITGDSVNPAHEMLIFDCYKLIEEKRYSYCILNLAMAFETFFSLYLRVNLLYRPFGKHRREDLGGDSLERLNELSSLLFETIKKYPFEKMRGIFLNRMLAHRHVVSFDEAETIIQELPKLVRVPSDEKISGVVFKNLKIAALLNNVKASKICELRNRVVHHRAYRPTLSEVENELQDARRILFPLGRMLGLVGDDANWYGHEPDVLGTKRWTEISAPF